MKKKGKKIDTQTSSQSRATFNIPHHHTHSTPTMCSSFLYPHLVSFCRRCHCDYNTIVHAAYVLQWCVSMRFSLSLAGSFFRYRAIAILLSSRCFALCCPKCQRKYCFRAKNYDVLCASQSFSPQILTSAADRQTHALTSWCEQLRNLSPIRCILPRNIRMECDNVQLHL